MANWSNAQLIRAGGGEGSKLCAHQCHPVLFCWPRCSLDVWFLVLCAQIKREEILAEVVKRKCKLHQAVADCNMCAPFPKQTKETMPGHHTKLSRTQHEVVQAIRSPQLHVLLSYEPFSIPLSHAVTSQSGSFVVNRVTPRTTFTRDNQTLCVTPTLLL